MFQALRIIDSLSLLCCIFIFWKIETRQKVKLQNMSEGWHSTVGLILACSSGFFVGLSLILQKKGLIQTAAKSLESGTPVSYLTNTTWLFGLLSMALGELSKCF